MKHITRQLTPIAALGWLLSFGALAQFAPDATMDLGAGYGQVALSQSILEGTRAIGAKQPASSPGKTAAARGKSLPGSLKATLQAALSRPASAAEPPEAAIQVLSFRSDPAVTAREQERIIAHLASQPDGGAGFTQAIRSGKLLGEFNRLLRRYDHSANNLGDVLAAHLIMSWEIVNDRDSRQVPAGQRAVRRQLMAPLAALPKYARMSDADKQAQAERTAYLTMISVTAYQSLKRSGDTAQLGSLQRNLREKFLASGIDLRRLELTDGGLVLH